MSERQSFIQTYSEARTWLEQVLAFARAAAPHVPPTILATLHADTDAWLAQIERYQDSYCRRCGTAFAEDLLGTAAYAVANGIRLCAPCYDDISGARGRATRHLARLTVVAQEHPDRCAALLVVLQRERQMSDRHLATWLGLDATDILRLALWPRPRIGRVEEDITLALAQLGGNPETIRAMLVGAGAANAPHVTARQRDAAPVSEAVERCARYRRIARALVERIAEPLGLDEHGIEGFFICDDEHGRYLAMSTDRARQQWHDAAYLHIYVPDDGQVIVEWNGTEDDIGAQLVAEGVREEDIVIGWL